jgi:hypothetical protein
MATPNGEDKQLNFVPKVYDPVAKTYKPLYIAPDATDKKQGDVYLSDNVSDTTDAATGMTAATPKAVKTVNDKTNKKLDKEVTTDQTVTSAVSFGGKVTATSGFVGDVTGNASTASALKTGRSISVKAGSGGTSGSATFAGDSDITITIPNIDATKLTGLVPLANLPQGALERLIHVSDEKARFALTTNDIQLGDSVIQDDTGVMYIVVDESKLNSSDGYQEYKSATALEAEHAKVSDKLGSATIGSSIIPIYLNSGEATASNATVGAENQPIYLNQGSLTVGKYELNKTVPADAEFTDTIYTLIPATSTVLGGVKATETNDIDSSAADVKISLTDSKLFVNPVTSTSLGVIKAPASDSGLILKDDYSLALSTSGVTTNNIEDGAVTLTKLASEVNVLQVSSEEPQDSHILFWIDTTEEED